MRKAIIVVTALLLLIPVAATAQNNPPVADAGEDETIILDAPTVLQGSATDPDDDPIVGWLWSVDSAPIGSFPTIHWPDLPDPQFFTDVVGEYVLSLVATDGLDWSEPDFVAIHVRELLPPEAVINVDVVTGYAPLTVHFDGSDSFVDPVAGELSYRWDFGDWYVQSPETSPDHVYELPDTYTAVLTVLDSLGQSDVDTIEITVEEPPPAWGEASVVGVEPTSPSKGLNFLIALLIPIGAVLLWKGLRKR